MVLGATAAEYRAGLGHPNPRQAPASPYGEPVAPTIRRATSDDVTALSRIYAVAVLSTVATFDTSDPPASYWLEKVASTEVGDHVIVAEDLGVVVGFAYSSPFRPRPAYAPTRETSIYLAPEAAGRGLGRSTYEHLLGLLRADGIHCAVAAVAQPNPASCALHEALGYEVVGTLREVGRKFDRWVDTRWYQLLLEERPVGARATMRW